MIPLAELEGIERLTLELPPPDPFRDAIALALVMGERGDDPDEVAQAILAAYEITGPVLELITNLAALCSLERDEADEFWFQLALDATNNGRIGHGTSPRSSASRHAQRPSRMGWQRMEFPSGSPLSEAGRKAACPSWSLSP